MAVTYTITAGDVSGVTPGSRLTEGVTFDWTNQKVFIPDTVSSVTSQFIVDNARFAEETTAGKARRQIVEGAGKTQIGSDPDSGLPIFTPTVAIFRDNWKIVSQKTTGDFVIRDVYADTGSITNIPYDAVAGVFIQYLTSVTGAVSQVNAGGGGGGGGASAADIWSYPQRTLTGTQATNLAAIPNIPTNPLLASNYTAPPTAATIADAVWDETLSQHLTAGSTGAKLNLASILTVGDIPAGLTAAQVWSYTGGDRALSGPQAVNLAATLGIVQAFAQGKFEINYANSTATQYNPDNTVLQVFELQDNQGNLATTAQTAVVRVPVGGATVAAAGFALTLGDLADVNLDNPEDGSVAVWEDGELTITDDIQRSNIIGGGSF